jgi:hypothetical protein
MPPRHLASNHSSGTDHGDNGARLAAAPSAEPGRGLPRVLVIPVRLGAHCDQYLADRAFLDRVVGGSRLLEREMVQRQAELLSSP